MNSRKGNRFDRLTDKSLSTLTRRERFELLLRCMAREDEEMRDRVWNSAPRMRWESPENREIVRELSMITVSLWAHVEGYRRVFETVYEFYKPKLNKNDDTKELDGEEFELAQSFLEWSKVFHQDHESSYFYAGVKAALEHFEVDLERLTDSWEKLGKKLSEHREKSHYSSVHLLKHWITIRALLKYAEAVGFADGARTAFEEYGLRPKLVLDAFGIGPVMRDTFIEMEAKALEIKENYLNDCPMQEWRKDHLEELNEITCGDDIQSYCEEGYQSGQSAGRKFIGTVLKKRNVDAP